MIGVIIVIVLLVLALALNLWNAARIGAGKRPF